MQFQIIAMKSNIAQYTGTEAKQWIGMVHFRQLTYKKKIKGDFMPTLYWVQHNRI